MVLSSIACLAGGIVVSGVLSRRQSRHARRVVTPRRIFASAAENYSTRPQIPARQLSPLLSIRSFCRLPKLAFCI